MALAFLNPKNWGRRSGGKSLPGAVAEVRNGTPEGPYTQVFESFEPRVVNPYLYEAIREAVPPVDGAINRIVTLDGIVQVEASSDALQNEIQQFMDEVPVNDLENGLQAFYASQGNELYEQGFTVGGVTLGDAGVERLRVADSKGVYFRRMEDNSLQTWYRKPAIQKGRRDGTDQIERVLRNTYNTGSIGQLLAQYGYQLIDPGLMNYAVFNPEADGPYGTSIIRSAEFDARVLLVMKNSTYRVWERFGDPIFNVKYKTKKKLDDVTLERRRKSIAASIADALAIKRSGNSADVVNALGMDDDLEITVLGSDGKELQIEMPSRFILEQIVSKTGLPSWMLGFHWSTAERLAERQGEIALQESKTRFARRKPGLERIVAMHLRARGITWRRGDWQLKQGLPSLQDLLAQAQAQFLDAQRELMLSGAGQSPAGGQQGGNAPKVIEIQPGGGVKFSYGNEAPKAPGAAPVPLGEKGACGCGGDHGVRSPHPGPLPGGEGTHVKAPGAGENYVEDGEELMRLESATEAAFLTAWDGLQADVMDAIGVGSAKAVKAPTFTFSAADMLPLLQTLEEQFVQSVAGEESAYARNAYRAWLRGVANGAAEFDGDAVDEAARSAMKEAMLQAGMAQVTDTTIRAFSEDILKALADGAYDGQNPVDVARALRARFEAHNYDWTRLARSEIADAQAAGKMSQYAAQEIAKYDWAAAGNSCPICIGRANDGPYEVGNGPQPMRDSHPLCRCTVMAVVE